VVATPRVVRAVHLDEIVSAISRHAQADWGDLSPDEAIINNASLRLGERLLSSYKSAGGVRFWIVTEGDRSATTVLLPDELRPHELER